MRKSELKVVRIGNSRGVRIPATILERYGIGDTVTLEERSDGILLRPKGAGVPKLSWEETARAIAAAGEDWSERDATAGDGLEVIPWEQPKSMKVAVRGPRYDAKRRGR